MIFTTTSVADGFIVWLVLITALFTSSTQTVNRDWQAKGICACAGGADRGNSRGVVKQSTIREKERGKSERRPISLQQLGFRPHKTIMLVSPPSLRLRCPLPGRWMALVTVQRSPTPSTSSSPCVSVRAAFVEPSSTTASTAAKPNSHCCRRRLAASFPLSFCRLLTVIKCLAFVLVRMREL